MVSLGIDIGTTTSAVAIALGGNVEVVQNEQGSRATPSCVAFKDRNPLIGTVALDEMDSNMENTIYGMRQMLGCKFEELPSSIKSNVFKLIKGDDELPKFEVQWCHDVVPEETASTKKHFSPEEIISHLIRKMVELVEMHGASTLEHLLTSHNGVIAVPACFNSSQRQATKDAAVIAGFSENAIRLIDEPIAAALAYGFQNKHRNGPCNLLIVDIGGGKCEVSIVEINGNEWGRDETYLLKGTSVAHFGGSDFDQVLADHFIQKNSLNNLSKTAMQHLRTACRSIKHKLTLLDTASIDAYLDGADNSLVITREIFEDLCREQFENIDALVNSVMSAAEDPMQKHEIHDYVLIGGSSRIPKMREQLIVTLGKQPNQTINPDEAVALGAAIYSLFFSEGRNNRVHHNRRRQLSIEILAGWSGNNDVKKHSKEIELRNQEPFDMEFSEGTGSILIKEFDEFEPLRTLKVPHVKMRVQLKMDDDGVLVVEDLERGMPMLNVCRPGCLAKEELVRMTDEFNKEKARNAAKRSLELYMYDICDQVEHILAANPTAAEKLSSTFQEAKELIASKTFPATNEFVSMSNALKDTFYQANGHIEAQG